MKFYESDNSVYMVQHITNASSIISSIVGIARKTVIDLFPKNYFKHVRVNTGLTFIEQNKNKLYDKNIDKIPYPSLTISPEIVIDNPTEIGEYPLLNDPNIFIAKNPDNVYREVMRDPADNYKIYTTFSRVTTNVQFSIKVKSFIEAVNLSYGLRARLTKGFHYRNKKLISVEVPKSFIKIIADMSGIGGSYDLDKTLENDLSKLEVFLAETSRSDTKIELKKDLKTGKWCFFYGTYVNILSLFDDLNVPTQPIRENQSESEYEISFRVQMTCNNPNNFIFKLNRAKLLKSLQEDNTLKSTIKGADAELSNGYMSLSIANLKLDHKDVDYFYDSNDNQWIGHNIVHQRYTYSINDSLKALDLKKILKQDLVKFHSYIKSKNIDVRQLFSISIVANSAGNGYSIDDLYNNLFVTFDRPITSDIQLDIWLNRALYDVYAKDITKDNFFFIKNALTYLNVDYNNERYKIRVYSFKNEKDMETIDVNKCVRINTSHGIGYIGLVKEGEKHASDVKVCVGFDDFNNPIVRCMELVDNE